jgi:hypothetical protein
LERIALRNYFEFVIFIDGGVILFVLLVIGVELWAGEFIQAVGFSISRYSPQLG